MDGHFLPRVVAFELHVRRRAEQVLAIRCCHAKPLLSAGLRGNKASVFPGVSEVLIAWSAATVFSAEFSRHVIWAGALLVSFVCVTLVGFCFLCDSVRCKVKVHEITFGGT